MQELAVSLHCEAKTRIPQLKAKQRVRRMPYAANAIGPVPLGKLLAGTRGAE